MKERTVEFRGGRLDGAKFVAPVGNFPLRVAFDVADFVPQESGNIKFVQCRSIYKLVETDIEPVVSPADFYCRYDIVKMRGMSTVSTPQFFTTQEAAEEIGITDAYVRTLIKKGEILATRAGQRLWLISADEVTRFKTRDKKGGRPRISQQQG